MAPIPTVMAVCRFKTLIPTTFLSSRSVVCDFSLYVWRMKVEKDQWLVPGHITTSTGKAGYSKQLCEVKSLHLKLEVPEPLSQSDWILQHLSQSLKNIKGGKFLNLLLSSQLCFGLTFHNSSNGCGALKLKGISDALLLPCPLIATPHGP